MLVTHTLFGSALVAIAYDLKPRGISCPTGLPKTCYEVMKLIPGPTSVFCNDFLRPTTTVVATTGSVQTTTTTTTTTVIVPIGIGKKARQLEDRGGVVTPPGLFGFASSMISSACSCLGVTAKIVSATLTEKPTTTTTTTTSTYTYSSSWGHLYQPDCYATPYCPGLYCVDATCDSAPAPT